MKDFISTTYTFLPGASGVGSVEISGIANFDQKRLVSVINQTRGVVLYATGNLETRATEFNGNIITFFVDTTTHNTLDILQIVYNDETPLGTSNFSNSASYWPSYGSPESSEKKELSVDTGGALVTRSAILTDEGTFRTNFANSSLAVSIGTITSIVGKVVTGSGFQSVDVHLKDYFKLNADPETSWMQIASIDSDTQITLNSNYVGGTSGAGSRSLAQPSTGAGASIAVSSGQCIITAGTTNNAVSFLNRSVDYGPLVFRTNLSISQRIANQNVRIGFAEGSSTPRWFARFRCDPSNLVNTTIICESARNPTSAPSVAETETTTVTIPNGGNTSQLTEYRIEQLSESVRFYINGVLVAEHTRSLPNPYDFMESGIRIENVGAPASSTIITINYLTTKNHNKVETGFLSETEKVVALQPPLVAYNYSVAGVIVINTDLLIIDCLQVQSLYIQAISIGTTGVVTSAWSNDGVNYINTNILTPAGVSVGNFNAPGGWFTPKFGRYFRLRLTTATTAGTTTLNVQGSQSILSQGLNPSVSQTGTWNIATLTTLSNGQTAHSAAATGSPLRIGGRVLPATPDLTLAAGDASDLGITTGQQALTKLYSAGEQDFTFNGVINNSAAAIPFKNAAGASIRNWLTSLTLTSDTLATATEVVIRDGDLAGSGVASNVFTTASHDFKIGDQVVFTTINTFTGAAINTPYWVLTVPLATTFTLSATPNGSVLAITGTGTFTINRILYRTKLQTTALAPTTIDFATPLRGAPNATMNIQGITASATGLIYYNARGYVGF